MLAFSDPPESMPVLTLAPVPRSSSPTDFKDLPYSPTLLLSAHFDAALTVDPEYHQGCECGFDSYFTEMHHWLAGLRGYTFVDCFHTLVSVRDYLLNEIVYDPVRNPDLLAWRAGWGLGWLSALALTDRSLALMGLELLRKIVLHDESDWLV